VRLFGHGIVNLAHKSNSATYGKWCVGWGQISEKNTGFLVGGSNSQQKKEGEGKPLPHTKDCIAGRLSLLQEEKQIPRCARDDKIKPMTDLAVG